MRKLWRFFAEYFVFVGGFLFIFVVGVIYALIRPESMAINLIFLLITIGWIVFLIKYFWDILEKGKKQNDEN
jgi:hypothetical protein